MGASVVLNLLVFWGILLFHLKSCWFIGGVAASFQERADGFVDIVQGLLKIIVSHLYVKRGARACNITPRFESLDD